MYITLLEPSAVTTNLAMSDFVRAVCGEGGGRVWAPMSTGTRAKAIRYAEAMLKELIKKLSTAESSFHTYVTAVNKLPKEAREEAAQASQLAGGVETIALAVNKFRKRVKNIADTSFLNFFHTHPELVTMTMAMNAVTGIAEHFVAFCPGLKSVCGPGAGYLPLMARPSFRCI